MKYALASITKSCTNFGNLLIEYNLLKLLKEYGFDEPTFVFDAFEDQDPQIADKINELDLVIVPGCTTLTTRFYPKIKEVLPKTKVPVINAGAAFGVKHDPESIDFAKYYFEPVGTRDPVSDKVLREAGYQTKFIGCPTLFSSDSVKFNEKKLNKISFGFGVKYLDEQIKLIDKAIESGYKVSVIIQTEEQRKLVKNKNVKIVEFEPEKVINEVSASDFVITGRLHIALPSIACGTPVLFIKTIDDTRFSLLEYLNIEMFSPSNLDSINLKTIRSRLTQNETSVYHKVQELRNKYRSYLALLAKNFS